MHTLQLVPINPVNSVMRVLVLLFLVTLFITPSTAQVSLSSNAAALINYSLKVMGMTQSDLAMPHDWVAPDRHRLLFHDKLFTQPLTAFDRVASYSTPSKTWDSDARQQFMENAMRDMELGFYRRTQFANSMSADDLNKRLRIDPVQSTGFVSSVLLYRVLGALVQASEGMEGARDRFFNQKQIHDMCDSLWRISKDNGDESLWDAYAAEEQARKRAASFFAQADPLMFEDIYIQGWSLYQHLLDVVSSIGSVQELLNDSVRTVILETPMGRIAVGGPNDDVYEGEFALIFDVGGNDVYRITNSTKATAASQAVHCIIDLAGNDIYTGNEFCLGGAIAGVNIVIDRSGDDVYKASNFSLGSSVFGVGILHDLDGQDEYIGGTNTQGSGIFGVGVLIDERGNDTYRCDAQGQGFGATRGVGACIDLSGNDQYIGSSPYLDALRYEAHYTTFTQGVALGYRPIASGGIGLLLDYSGNDTYITDIYGQGSAYWFGLGALYDESGEDRYQAYQYAQGAGVHFATGLLIDNSGSDYYTSHGVSQGCGHDVAFGALIDEAGSDSYVCESLSLGGGNANAVSIFVDVAGNDAYIAMNESNTMGFSDFRRSYGMIGIFVDGGGEDKYTSSSPNNSTTIKSSYGVFADLALTSDSIQTQPTPTYVTLALADNLDSLFVQASVAQLKYQNNVTPARQKLADLGKAALPGLINYFDTQMPRERLTLEYVLPKIYEAFPDTIRLLIQEFLLSDNPAEVTLMCTVAGKVKDTLLTASVAALCADTSWKARRTAAQTLSEIGDTSSVEFIKGLLTDEHPMVRSRAGFALGQLAGKNALPLLRNLLDDDAQVVRYGAVEGMIRGSRIPMSSIVSVWRSTTSDESFVSSARLLYAADTSKTDVTSLTNYLRSASEPSRAVIYKLLPGAPEFWKRNAYEYTANETNPALLKEINTTVSAYPAPSKKKRKK